MNKSKLIQYTRIRISSVSPTYEQTRLSIAFMIIISFPLILINQLINELLIKYLFL